MATETKTKRRRSRQAGVREIARLTGYSPAHVCETRKGTRLSRRLRAKMRELGLTFKPSPPTEAQRHGASVTLRLCGSRKMEA